MKIVKIISVISFLLVSLQAFSVANSQEEFQLNSMLEKPYMWFDLGDVVIDTRSGFSNLRYMPGALRYIKKLKQEGYKVGLITNIPEKWGKPGDWKSKISFLEKVLKKGWKGKDSFTLENFDKVLLPLYASEQKPAAKLFLNAIAISKKQGRKAIFQGESLKEVAAAKDYGMKSFHVSVCADCGKNGVEKTLFMPFNQIK